jgi:hypothetical protein
VISWFGCLQDCLDSHSGRADDEPSLLGIFTRRFSACFLEPHALSRRQDGEWWQEPIRVWQALGFPHDWIDFGPSILRVPASLLSN